jgi:dihydropteroate synthase
MGILNVTPDSFSDGGHYLNAVAAAERALAMQDEGADLIDIGGESSRPGSDPIDEEEELTRLMPVIDALSGRLKVPLSVDTTKAAVARRALEGGASVVNDISALRFDPAMGRLVAETGAGIVLMHMQGIPKTMQNDPVYHDVTAEVRQFFVDRMQVAKASGILPEQILLDPGIGFGKNLGHNLTLLANLKALTDLGRPLVVGASRKGFIGQLVSGQDAHRRMGTAAAVAMAVSQGARVIRVHDVAAMCEVVRVVEAIVNWTTE